MRIKHTDPEADKVIAVLVDGKRVAMPLEADEEAGYCLAAMPAPKTEKVIKDVDTKTDDPKDTTEPEWVTVRMVGDVQIIMKE